jgi:hypothetical protein
MTFNASTSVAGCEMTIGRDATSRALSAAFSSAA